MANKRINELALRTPQTTDLMLIGDPTTGYSYKTTLLSALNLGVPTTRTITINGTTFDLSANRSWSVGTVTSVGLTMPSAFNVASSPVTGSGTIAVTAAGLASQYIRGDGTLADFPGGGGGGGASVSYYLNGSVNQGTLGGVTYYEMNKTPILGAGTNFTTSSNGYIASFLTDAGDPALLKIPGGNWNTEFYFAASSGGGTPTYYIELYKYDGTTFTLIASSSSNPDAITGGTSVEQYFTTLAVPETILTATDRLAIRIYVTTAGRTITLHTENSNLCQIITTFTTGLTALNGLTAQVQYFATGSAGTDFNISSSTATHTFNIPTASATNRGLLSTADWTTFNNKVSSIIAGNAITVSNASGNVTVNHADTSGADPGATISGSNVFRSIVLDTYGHVTGLSYSSFLISDLGGTAISSPSNGQVLSYNGTNWVNSSLSSLSIITGSGTTNWVPKFTSASAIGLSNIYDGGSFIGVFTATDNLSGAKLQVSGAATFSGSVTAGNAFITTGAVTSNQTGGQFGYSGSSVSLLGAWGANTSTRGILSFYLSNSSGTNGNEYARLTDSLFSVVPAATFSSSVVVGGSSGYAQRIFTAYADGTDFAATIQQNNTNGGGLQIYRNSASWGNTPFSVQTTTGTQLILNASGNVGIGTASPSRILHLSSSGSNSAIRLDNTVSGRPFLLTYDDSQNLTFINSSDSGFTAFNSGTGASTTKMLITNSGNVGIGTTSPSSATWGKFIQVEATYPGLVLNSTASGGVKYSIGADAGTLLFRDETASSSRMVISSSGNVGIGTASPSARLTVVGASTVINQTNVSARFSDDFESTLLISHPANTGNTATITGNNQLAFATGVTGSIAERLRITSSGRTLIGTTTDNTVDLLQVAGNITTIGTSSSKITMWSNFSGGNVGLSLFNTSGTENIYLNSANGRILCTTIQTSAPTGGTAQPWKLGNVATVSPTSPNRTIEVEVNGTTYYIHAKTTNN